MWIENAIGWHGMLPAIITKSMHLVFSPEPTVQLVLTGFALIFFLFLVLFFVVWTAQHFLLQSSHLF